MKSLLLSELQGITKTSTDTPIQATGGEEYELNENDVIYRVHVFKTSGEFRVISAGSVGQVEYLVVAGGGGGGGVIGGGGGAGGFLTGITTVTAQTYPVIIGAGGLGGFSWNSSVQLGFNGTDSSALGQTAIGGGGGGAHGGNDTRTSGSVGGSGGGAGNIVAGAAGTLGQGFEGGAGAGASSQGNNGGGGGGAFRKGSDGINAVTGGQGGHGKTSDITGTTIWYSGGGGGGTRNTFGVGGTGGRGGGGNGGTTDTSKSSIDGVANTGGGGGGGGHNGSTAGTVRSGANGGSGVVVIKYPLRFLQPIQATGGVISEIMENGVTYRVHNFSAAGSGNFTVTDTGSQGRIDYLFVGGGGGGGGRHGGGGGGGGVVLGSMLVETGTYPVVAGSGGAGAVTDTSGINGGDSMIDLEGYKSVYFDGTTDYLKLSVAGASSFGADPFTFETWIYSFALGDRCIYDSRNTSTGAPNHILFTTNASGQVAVYSGNTLRGTSTGTFTTNRWHHVAVVREGTGTNQTKFYINGNAAGTFTLSDSLTDGTGAAIGAVTYTPLGAGSWNGYISNLRIIKGEALYTSDFAVPSRPLESVIGTSLLTCRSSTLEDISENTLTVTAVNNAVVSNHGPFNIAAIGGGGGGSYGGASYPVGKVGGSGGGGGHGPSVGAAGILGQGYAGGNGNSNEGAGGGGAGGVGENGGTFGGRGGHGLQVKFLNNEYYFSGGGGGGGWETAAGAGGFGGGGGGGAGATGVGNGGRGGTGGINPGEDGVSGTSGAVSGGAGGQYTGGGGGGSGQRENASYTGVGGNGGSGVAIIRYPIHYPKIIRTTNRSSIYMPGSIVQCVYVRSDNRTFYTGQTTGNGTTIGELALTIKPKRANSILMMKWMINGEVHQDVVFLVHRNGSLIFDGGYESFNNEVGNQRWSGIVAGPYETTTPDYSTTPNNFMLRYWIPAINTDMRTYAPAVRSSSTTAYNLHLNRVQNTATGTNAQEITVSSGVIMEIAQ